MRLPFCSWLDRSKSLGNTTAPNREPRVGLHVDCAMLTDVGRKRAENEDAVVFVAPDPGTIEYDVGFLALVADGMGGHAAGEIASSLAAETIRSHVYSFPGDPNRALASAFEEANKVILEHSAKHPETRGMGTTCTAVLVSDDLLWLAHVGDSRAYLFRDGALEQLSDDQTLHAQLIRDGAMTPAETSSAAGGNFILQALGAREAIKPTIFDRGLALRAGDSVVLCSDGLHGLVTDAEIAASLAEGTPQQACRALIERANTAGGDDNISVGVLRFSSSRLVRDNEQAATKPIIALE